jgi:hypothetical protein
MKTTLFKKALFGATVLVASGLLQSCGFCVAGLGEQMCKLLNDHSLSEIKSSDRSLVFEKPGVLVVYHGTACAESNRSGKEVVPKIGEQTDLPAYVTNATVFLNGWNLNFLSGDHHIAGLGVVIDSIKFQRSSLSWEAAGILSDNSFDGGYQWCYNYTVLGWNSTTMNLSVDHQGGGCSDEPQSGSNFYVNHNAYATTALSSTASFIESPVLSSANESAILPLGFAYGWDACDDDHHLLQIAYNMDHSEAFLEKDKRYRKKFSDAFSSLPHSTGGKGSGFISWESSVIFKDNSTRRDYAFGELVSGVGGEDLGVIDPPFSILPEEDISYCGSVEGHGRRTREYIVEKIPYEYAVPVLSGWDLNYLCDDEHVKEMGVLIDKFRYAKAPNASTGTLYYTLSSVLKDKNNYPDFVSRHKIRILGIKATSGRILRSRPSKK